MSSLSSGFLAILLGLMEDQIYHMLSYGGRASMSLASKGYSFEHLAISALGLVLFLLFISVEFTFLVFRQQAVPASASIPKEGLELPHRKCAAFGSGAV